MADDKRKKAENWMRNLLLGSLGLNVFLAGFLFAKVLTPSVPETQLSTPVRFTLGGLPTDLPMDLRESLEDSFRLHSAEVEETYMELVEARLRVKEILELEELDQETLQEVLKEVRELQIKIQIPMHEVLVQAAIDLDAESRRELLFLGDRFDGRGLWNPRKFDGARWRVQFENGEIILDFEGITDRNEADEGEE